MKRFSDFFERRPQPAAINGFTIFFLQKKIERFSGEQMTAAMQRAWGRAYDKTNFYGMSIDDGVGGLLKMDAMFFPLQHFDRKLDGGYFRRRELPSWAVHSAYTQFGYSCPGGLPPGPVRDQMGWLLGRFCGELLGENTVGLLFAEAELLIPYTSDFDKRLRSEFGKNPETLFSPPSASLG